MTPRPRGRPPAGYVCQITLRLRQPGYELLHAHAVRVGAVAADEGLDHATAVEVLRGIVGNLGQGQNEPS